MIQDAQGSFAGLRDIVDKAGNPVNQTLKDLQHTAANARTFTRELETRTDTRLKQVSGQIDTLLESLNSTVQMLETLVWLNTSENLKQLSLEIRQYPGRLLLERPPEKLPEDTFEKGQ